MKRYIIPKGTEMYVANDAGGNSWPQDQPNNGQSLFNSTHEVEYTDDDFVGYVGEGKSLIVFRLPKNPYGPYLILMTARLQIIDE